MGLENCLVNSFLIFLNVNLFLDSSWIVLVIFILKILSYNLGPELFVFTQSFHSDHASLMNLIPEKG